MEVYHDANRLLYVPSPPVFCFFSGFHKAFDNDDGLVSRCLPAENHLMRLAYFFTACRSGYSPHISGYLQFFCHHDGFIVCLQTVISADLNIADQNDVMRTAGFHSVVRMLTVRCSRAVDWGI